MKNFFYNKFFDTSSFQHSQLLEKQPLVWNLLKNLKNYLSSYKLGNILSDIPSTCHIINKELISIGKHTMIENGAYIQGPCIIGDHCIIRHNAYIRGFVITGDHCVLGHATEIKNSLLFHHVHAAHFAYIGDSILGNYVNLGAGVRCANVRLDQREVFVFFNEKKIPSGFKKLGAILGDHVQIGCNSVLNPGTIIGKHTHCYGCLNIFGTIPEHSLVKSSQTICVSKK